MARDSQRQKVYDAERAAWAEITERGLWKGVKLDTVADCREYLESIVARKTIQRWFDRAAKFPVHVADGRGTSYARGGLKSVGVYEEWADAYVGRTHLWVNAPRWSRTEGVLIHELTHCLVPIGGENPAHGWRFCEAYLKIMGNVVGPEARDILKAQFKAHRVRYRPKRTRNLTPAQREAAAQRLAKARAAKASKADVEKMA